MLGIYLQSKENKKKQRAVYFRIRTSSGSFTISTGIRATAKQWNRKTQKLKPLSEFECMLNVKLTHQRESIEKSLALYRAFDENWQKEWFTYSIEGWGRRTNKLSCDIWKASHSNAKIYIEIFSGKPNKLVIGIDDYAVELEHNGDKWQKYSLTRDDFKDATGNGIESWVSVKELRILEQDNISSLREGEKVSKKLGQKWKGEKPLFRYLKWMD